MNFGLSKFATIGVKRGKVTDCVDIKLPEGTTEALPISSAYKYCTWGCWKLENFSILRRKQELLLFTNSDYELFYNHN